jgi:hypothetical protein
MLHCLHNYTETVSNGINTAFSSLISRLRTAKVPKKSCKMARAGALIISRDLPENGMWLVSLVSAKTGPGTCFHPLLRPGYNRLLLRSGCFLLRSGCFLLPAADGRRRAFSPACCLLLLFAMLPGGQQFFMLS